MTIRYIIIGGGVAGLVTARRLLSIIPGNQILILERNHELGGLLSGIKYDSTYYFDTGTHIFRETGDEMIDEFILRSVKEDDLIYFELGEGDVAGSVFDGKLQKHTHFPDIRSRSNAEELVKSLLVHSENTLKVSEIDRQAPLLTVATNRFGSRYTNEVISPMLSNMYQKSAEELAGFALLLPGLTRVVVNEYSDWLTLSEDDIYRALFAIENQRWLPNKYKSTKRNFYSKSLGTRSFVNGMTKSLLNEGVKISTGTQITSLNLENKFIEYLNRSNELTKLQFDGLTIATGVFGAATLLGVDFNQFEFEKPMMNRVINIVVEGLLDSEICYFYGLDPQIDFYRVTNYRGFSGNFQDSRLSIEVLGYRGLSNDNLVTKIVEQLYNTGFLKSKKYSFADVVTLKAGFPSPSIKNMNELNKLSKHVNFLLPKHAFLSGIGAEEGLFFQNEIIQHACTANFDLLM